MVRSLDGAGSGCWSPVTAALVGSCAPPTSEWFMVVFETELAVWRAPSMSLADVGSRAVSVVDGFRTVVVLALSEELPLRTLV